MMFAREILGRMRNGRELTSQKDKVVVFCGKEGQKMRIYGTETIPDHVRKGTIADLRGWFTLWFNVPGIHFELACFGKPLPEDGYLDDYTDGFLPILVGVNMGSSNDMPDMGSEHDMPVAMKVQWDYINIRLITGKTVRLLADFGLRGTVLKLKKSLLDVENIPVDQQRIVFNGKHLAPGDSLIHLKINPNDTLHCVLRLRGGGPGAGLPFCDVTVNRTIEMDLARRSAAWWKVIPGTNLQGICRNTNCVAHNKKVIMKIGMGRVKVFRDGDKINCPGCREYVAPVSVWFYDCDYMTKGIKVGSPGSKPTQHIGEWKTVEKLLTFDQARCGLVDWLELTIFSRSRGDYHNHDNVIRRATQMREEKKNENEQPDAELKNRNEELKKEYAEAKREVQELKQECAEAKRGEQTQRAVASNLVTVIDNFYTYTKLGHEKRQAVASTYLEGFTPTFESD